MAKRKKHKKASPGKAVALFFFWFAFICMLALGMNISGAEIEEVTSSVGKNHRCISDEIDATVAKDGSLHVVDSRTYDFSGTYTLSAIELDPPLRGEEKVHGVSVIEEDGTRTELKKTEFKTQWRTTGGPASGHYAYDEAYETIYAFSTTTDAKKTFVFDYTYTNAIERYEDTSVLYWQFIPSGWDVDTNNATMTVHLPVAKGDKMAAGENVLMFGHGAVTGEVQPGEVDGDVVYTIPKVRSGTFAEARIAFPRAWTPDVSSETTHKYDYLPIIEEEEKQWQLETQLWNIANALALIVPIALSVLLIIMCIVLFLRHGKEYKPQFNDEYWRDVPQKGIHPAVIGRLLRWDEEDANDLTATLMHMSAAGQISIDRTTTVRDRKILPDKVEDDYVLTLLIDERPADMSDIDRRALDLIFDKVARGKNTVTLDRIRTFAKTKSYAKSYVTGIERWQQAVSKETMAADFFEAKGESLKGIFRGVAVLLAIVAVVVSSLLVNFAPLLGIAPGVAALAAFSTVMPRRSREAVEIHARCQALKRWFKDFTALDEAIPTDAKVWGELLVYAYLLGVSKQVVEDLNKVHPEIWDDGSFAGTTMWYYNPHASSSFSDAASGNDFFGNAFANTLSSAESVVAASQSSSGGGGGGFSGGGGGGFGGGGGGFSR